MEGEPVNVNEFQELARQALPKIYYDYYSGGAEDEYTLKQNVEAFQGITIRPRILVDVSRIDLSTTVLGYQISVPILIAPSAKHKWAHPEGEVATARAAALCDTIMILSYRSTCTIEEVASSCNAVRFFQCYVYKRRDISANLLQRAERCGYKAIVLTVDSPRLGRREKDIKNKMVNPQLKNFEGLISTRVSTGSVESPSWKAQLLGFTDDIHVYVDDGSKIEAFDANTAFDASLSWKDIGWLRSITNLPVLLKGVLTHEDAIKAVEVGVDGIVVSNHGARQGKGRFYVGIVMELALLVDLGAPWMTDIKATILSHQRRFTIQAFVISSVSWINICFTPVVFLACTSLLYT
ncbi:Peroxisomal (S)-2-hydroxy-acid oxidase GLO4 -like protein [Gossypium arboreum]|uniref:(S)-2-hydroxy-acid oxidase n=1 Tax=Gossypium arboreum TaxID=29729 RepID=A0A0B0P6L0_GOSAR|nr:Peroxisomal (S)-2-hydroxy-acid oxidase GLO4 -like protein [Gossypium arboreum]